MTESNHSPGDPPAASVPVLIVGGSLVGSSAAVFLAWRGVPVVLVERHLGSSLHPRAIGYTTRTRTLELFRAVGIEVPESAHGSGPPRRARVESLAGRWLEEYPWTPPGQGVKEAVEYSPAYATAIAQDRLEPILRQRAHDLGADLRPGVELIGFTADGSGGDRDPAPPRRWQRIPGPRAVPGGRRWCGQPDPRRARHRPRRGGLLSVQRSILFRAPLEEYLRRGVVQFEIEQPDFRAFLTTYSDGRWVLMLSDDLDRDEEEQRQLVRQASGLADVPVELITTGRWELAALIADRFSSGRVFLAGDAAHQLPPNRGGFGANTGIDDAHNLAWKLAAVLAGQSAPELLATYDTERRAIAQLRHEQIFARADYKAYMKTPRSGAVVLDDAAIELGQLYRSGAVAGAADGLPPARPPDEWAGQPGTRAPHLWVTVDDDRRSTLDLFQREWVLLSEDARWALPAAQASAQLGVPVTFVQIGVDARPVEPGQFRTAYGVGLTGATLVRPDGYIAWRAIEAPADPAQALTGPLERVSFPRAISGRIRDG